MKTKQAKEELDKSTDEDTLVEPKTRARKKASDVNEEEKPKSSDEPKTSKELPKKTVVKPKAIVKKRPLGIRKALRSKKVAAKNNKLKNVIKQTVKRGRKPAQRTEPANSQDKDTVPLIPPSEIKKEPVDETSPNSRSSSPKTAGRRLRLSSDMIMVKSVLADPPSSLVLAPRTSPYSMRSERSNSPSLFEGKNLRSGKPRKVKSNLLNEVVLKEQKKRRRLLSDAKPDASDGNDDCKKLKRGRSCSRDGSEISKCSDITESDISLSDTLNDTDKELNKKLNKPKTDLDLDIENNIQISTMEKVPSLNIDSKLAGTKLETENNSMIHEKIKKKQSLKRSTSLDSDNNNSNRIKLDTLNASDIEDKLLMKTEDDTLFEARSSILTSMSKTFNSKEMSKNIRKVRRGRKSNTMPRPSPNQPAKNGVSSTVTHDLVEEKVETIETLSKEIDDLINNLDQNINKDSEIDNVKLTENTTELTLKSPPRVLSTSKPLGDNNIILGSETPIKEKEMTSATAESTPSKTDDSENIRLHYEEDSIDQPIESSKVEITYKSVASIDKLMGRLKEFEEFDKRRQRQETKQDNKQVMVSNDVVLIPKSGADIKPLKDIQSVKSPERTLEKENVLSCFENNSAISILKRDHVRRSIDIDLPNSVTLIKRNSISSRKESTSSNHSKESDAISIFEKSLGKDVTLTEIKKADRQTTSQPDLNQLATLQPNNANTLAGMGLDSSQISITPRIIGETKANSSEIQITKRKSSDSISRKSSESGSENTEEKMAVIEKIKSPSHGMMFPAVSITPTPVAVKSPEVQPLETEALAPPLETVNAIPADIPLKADVPPVESTKTSEAMNVEKVTPSPTTPAKLEESTPSKPEEIVTPTQQKEKTEVPTKEVEPLSKKQEHNKKVDQPTKKVEQPTKKVEQPTKKVEQPAKKVEQPAKKVEQPTKKVEQPTKKVEQLAQNDESIIKELESDITSEETIKENLTDANEKVEKEEAPAKVKTAEVKSEEKAKSVKPKSARNSIENQPGPSNMLHETPESQKRKENVLRTLGLLTHKAANEALKQKLKEKERIYGQSYSGNMSKGKSSKSGDYTGTLKTVIKLNRSTGERDKKKYRSSLKMTFQKSKNRSGKPPPEVGQAVNEDDAYYTIERREAAATEGGHRKTHYSNRVNNHADEAAPEPETKETLVIPEKASSFSIHPGRLCMDQCFYCGGKFGLFDTPCHIAQMKSSERQKKVLDNEEKLTIDSCLCDACYRHVDRRANCPSYKKRPPKMAQPVGDNYPTVQNKPQPPSPPMAEDSEEETTPRNERPSATCHAEGCVSPAEHSIKRKWLIKMRASVNKLVRLRGDYPGLHTVPLCARHHAQLAPLRRCALCTRALPRLHHAQLLQQNYTELNPILQSSGIPVRFSSRPVLCKLCRYYCSVLLQPGYSDAQAQGYRKKLLQIHKVDIPPDLENAPEQESPAEDPANVNKQKCKKTRTKSKQRKSSDPDKPSDRESSEQTNDSTPEKDKQTHSDAAENKDVEEDIESLISSNKIPVPGALKHSEVQSDGSEIDPIDIEAQINVTVDKHTELQYLLQKQNNPTQFIHNQPNLTYDKSQKSSNKTLNAITKPGQQQRIHDKNAKKIQKIGQMVIQRDRSKSDDDDKSKEPSMAILRNLSLNEECTIESIPNKKPADINTLKNKWQQSESFTQVKKNLSELSKNHPATDKEKKTGDPKYSNPVKRLETNPSISVRELFPGEEEMNLQCNIEFNNVKGVTPEGWEKCNSVIQYDLETKRLWTELQRPYGNQSSFLRHLILLEKYFRSGDLILSHNATPHAINYSDSVQARLRAYDNVPYEPPRRHEPAISLIEFRKKPSVNGKSLLKTNNTEDKEAKKFVAPPPKPKPAKVDKPKSKPLPPELIAINTPNSSRKTMHTVLHNIQKLVKGVTASDPIEVASAPLPPPPKIELFKEKKDFPKSDTPKKQKPTSKPWRPTLMPITPENLAKIAREPTQVAVDGRKLPSLVQVMSSGKRYHITLQDYNKMCIMRREKLQQIQDGDKTKKSCDDTTVVTEIQTSSMLGNGGTVVQNILNDKESQEKKEMPELSQISSNAATILKNVGLKNITIAPILPKTATITSQTISSPIVTNSSLLVTSTPIKIPQLGPAVSITNETVFTSNLPVMSSNMIMPKIPKSLTVIPQTIMTSLPQTVVVPITSAPTQATSDGPKP